MSPSSFVRLASTFATAALVALTLAATSHASVQDAPKGQDAPKSGSRPSDADSAIASLVPADAFCIVKVPSLEALSSTIHAVKQAVAPDSGKEPDVDELLHLIEIPGRIDLIDHKRPLALCLSFGGAGIQPVPTFILPVTSRDEFLKSVANESGAEDEGGAEGRGASEKPAAPGKPGAHARSETHAKPVALGDYVGVTELSKYSAADKPRALATGLLPGAISARIDLERVFQVTRPSIEPMLSKMEEGMESAPSPEAIPGMDTKALAKQYMDGFRAFIDSADTLDIATSMQGGRSELAFVFTALEKSALADMGSKEKSGIETSAKYFDPDAMFSLAVGVDFPALMNRFQPMLDGMMTAYPEPLRQSMTAGMTSFKNAYALLFPGMCVSADVAPAGLRGAAYFRAKDTKAVIDQYVKGFKDMKFQGVTFRGPESVTIDGTTVSQLHVEIDAKAFGAMAGEKADAKQTAMFEDVMKKFLGPNGLSISYAAKGDQVVQVLGGDEAYLRRALSALNDSGRKLPREMQSEIERMSSSNPCFVGQVDVARYTSVVASLVASLAPDGKTEALTKVPAPAPFLFYGGIEGRVWRGGSSCDLQQVASSIREAFKDSATGKKSGNASRGKAIADIHALASAASEYAIQHGGQYPESLALLVTPDSSGHTYLEGKFVPRDPWGREYLYELPKPGHVGPRIYTYGKDGKPGGSGEDADIDNETTTKDD
jgi:general secretion pathway protein G